MSIARPLSSCLALALLGGALLSVPAQADWRPSGAASGTLLIREGDHDLGGAVLVDFWRPIGPLRLGGVFGAAAITSDLSDDEKDGRVFAPLGLSLALVKRPEPVGVSLRARGGIWAGAVPNSLGAGGWLTIGAHLEIAIDPSIALSAGMDAWFLFGHGDTALFAPTLSVVWTIDE